MHLHFGTLLEIVLELLFNVAIVANIRFCYYDINLEKQVFINNTKLMELV